MLAEWSYWIGLIVVGVAPGVALCRALRVNWSWPETLAAAPGLSLALIAFLAYAASYMGIPVRPFHVLALAVALIGFVYWMRRTFWRVVRHTPPQEQPENTRWVPWLVLLSPLPIYQMLEPMLQFLIPPTLHDGMNHTVWFRCIIEFGSLEPRWPFDGGYMRGMHAWAALHAQLTSVNAATVFQRDLIFLFASLPLGVYSLACQWMPRGWPAVTAAFAATMLFTATNGILTEVPLVAPIGLLTWGGYPFAAGLACCVPVARLTLAALGNFNAAGLFSSLIVGIGCLAVYPAQALAAALIVAVSAVTARYRWWAQAMAIVPIAALLIVDHYRLFLPLEGFKEELRSANPGDLEWFRTAYPQVVGYTYTALLGLGLASAVLIRQARPVAGLFFGTIYLMSICAPDEVLTTLWYHEKNRIMVLLGFATPPAIGLAVWMIMRSWSQLIRPRWIGRHVAPALILLVILHLRWDTIEVARGYVSWTGRATSLYVPGIQEDLDWIEANIPEGDTILNSPDDWGAVYAITGRREVLFRAWHHTNDPELAVPSQVANCFGWARTEMSACIAMHFPTVGASRCPIADALRTGPAHWVYVSQWPRGERQEQYVVSPLDFGAVEDDPCMERRFQSPLGTVYYATPSE